MIMIIASLKLPFSLPLSLVGYQRLGLPRFEIQMEEQVQEFTYIEPRQSHSFRQESPHQAVLKGCEQLQAELVHQYLKSTVKDIYARAQYTHQHQETKDCCQIVTVQFKKNQMQDFTQFIKMLQAYFEDQKHLIFSNFQPSKVDYCLIMRSEVREIVLNMYIFLEQNPQFDQVVFIVNEISDLDEFNMYCFEKGLKGRRLLLIICSHYQFESKLQNATDALEKLHYKLYNAKELFCQYIYECLASPVIKPYLPPEVLTLVSDMQYYSLSYKEACRRFRFCVERGLMLYKKERTWVDFVELVKIIETALQKAIKDYHGFKGIAKEKLLKAILTDEEGIHIPEKVFLYEIEARPVSQGVIEEQDILHCMRGYLKIGLGKDQLFKKYVEYLDQVKSQSAAPRVGRKKKSRFEMLGIELKKTLNPKQLLQSQITHIIKDATVGIRQQAAHISWQEIKYQQRIKPQLPYLIKEAWAADIQASDLVQAITKNYSAPLTHYLKEFESKDIGKGIYLTKCLQLAGLIEIRKSQVKPMVYTTFYDKANFKVLS